MSEDSTEESFGSLEQWRNFNQFGLVFKGFSLCPKSSTRSVLGHATAFFTDFTNC
jgi:hypothetical protein